VFDAEAGDKVTSLVDDSSSDEYSAAEHSSELESSTIDVTNYPLCNCASD